MTKLLVQATMIMSMAYSASNLMNIIATILVQELEENELSIKAFCYSNYLFIGRHQWKTS